jgi:hypothetical protein
LCWTEAGHIDSDNCKPLAKNISILPFSESKEKEEISGVECDLSQYLEILPSFGGKRVVFFF